MSVTAILTDFRSTGRGLLPRAGQPRVQACCAPTRPRGEAAGRAWTPGWETPTVRLSRSNECATGETLLSLNGGACSDCLSNKLSGWGSWTDRAAGKMRLLH